MILDKKNSYFGNIWYQSSQSLADSLPDYVGQWKLLPPAMDLESRQQLVFVSPFGYI